MKSKLLTLALATSFVLSSCGNNAKQSETGNADELMKRIGQLEEENKQLKTQLEEIDKVQEQQPVETDETSVAEDNNIDTSTQETSDIPSSGLTEQIIQSQPGNTQEENYFVLKGNNGTYKQIGDAFVVDDKYEEGQIVVIPINFTNENDDTQDPWFAFAFDFKAIQEDDTQEYNLNGGQGGVPDEYDNPINMNLKPGASTDYYLTFRQNIQGGNITFKDIWDQGAQAILKFQ